MGQWGQWGQWGQYYLCGFEVVVELLAVTVLVLDALDAEHDAGGMHGQDHTGRRFAQRLDLWLVGGVVGWGGGMVGRVYGGVVGRVYDRVLGCS